MGVNLDRTKPADWTKDPVVPVAGEPVKASAQPGAVDPAFQDLYSRIFDTLRGKANFQSLWVTPTKAAGAPITTVNGIQIDFTGGRFIGLTVELTEPQVRVFGAAKNTSINDDSISSNWGFLADVQGVYHTILGASAQFAGTGITYTGVANPGRTVNAANKIIPALACKAWGFVQANNGIAVQEGEGGWTASVNGNTIRVTLGQALADANYVVNVGVQGTGGWAREITGVRTTTTFDIGFYNDANTIVPANAPGAIAFQFTLFGRR